MNSIIYPLRIPFLAVKQPLGEFYIAVLPARVLLDTAYSDRLQAVKNADGTYRLEGSQRELLKPRQRDIGKFIDTVNAAFPNSIILAANFRETDGLIEEDVEKRWSLLFNEDGNSGTIVIPQGLKLCPIIDGQHRVFGFNYAEISERLDMPLVCSIYFDLPRSYQAYLFATVNSNQRAVSKSQTYELFGYNIEDEDPERWTPEKLSVFLTRKLNSDEDSPFLHHIVIAAENDLVPSMAQARRTGNWAVSTATVVEGIVKLISSNPKADAYKMDGELVYEGKGRSVLEVGNSLNTPLRQFYVQKNDTFILAIIKNYFKAVSETLWSHAIPDSFIRKTVGLQALFDVARALFRRAIGKKDISKDYFKSMFIMAENIDFSDDFFEASGTGRSHIRAVIELAMGLRETMELNADPVLSRDANTYRRLLNLVD